MRRHHTSQKTNGGMSCFEHFRALISDDFSDGVLPAPADLSPLG
jgi:hypothetical protein